jgi:hypothetical protein
MLTGTWTPLANPAPTKIWGITWGLGTMLLQSDGTVMANEEFIGQTASKAWLKLTPDSTGSYVNGTWSALAPMSLERRFFASDVLFNDKVFVAGGEYSGPSSANNNTNTGEIYDPIVNSWSSIANFPESKLGDAPSEVLRDGRVLVGSINTSNTYIYNPTSNSWSNGPSLPNGDTSSEESWVTLPDGSILSYEIGGSKPQTANLFEYGATDALDQWVSVGNVPVKLDSNGGGTSPELGPGVLMPNGTVFFIGASGNTALYTEPTPSAPNGTSSIGPQIKDSSGNLLGAFDAPAAVMPNGKVLFAAGPIDGKNFSGPTTFFEYDPSTNAITQVGQFNSQPYETRMLVLPSGQVLVNVSSNVLQVYTPDSGPQASWRPTISHISAAGAAYTLWGTQLNGLSEGAAYGDDAQMASNYPIVELTDSSGKVSYARTWNWDSQGVAPGNTPEHVDFMLPLSDGPGIYLVTVIANGIASTPVAAVFGSQTLNDSVIVDSTSGSGPAAVDLTLQIPPLVTFTGQFLASAIAGVDVLPGWGSDTVDVRSTLGGTPTWISSGWNGNDTVVLSSVGAPSVQGINGQVDIENSPFDNTTIDVLDAGDSAARNVVLSSFLNYPGTDDPGLWGSITGLAPAAIEFEYFWTSGLNVFLGQGSGTTLKVQGTGVPTRVNDSTSVAVTVGNQGSVQGISGSLSIEGPNTSSTITVDDSADSIPHFTYLDPFVPAGDTPWGSIVGLAPAEIDYEYADTKSLTVDTGPGGGGVYVRATGVPTALVGNGASFRDGNGGGSGPGATVLIDIGNNGTVEQIDGPLTIENPPGSDTISVDDSADSTPRLAVLDSIPGIIDTTWGSISALAPAQISYEYADTQSLTIYTGLAGGVAEVHATGVPTTLIGAGTGSNNGLAGGGGPPEYINIGQSGSAQAIDGPLSLESPTGLDNVTIDDSSDSEPRKVILDRFTPAGDTPWGSISGIAPAEISYEAADVGSPFAIKGGKGGNTFLINALASPSLTIDLDTGAGNDQVNLPTTPGPLVIDGQGGSNTLVGPNVPNTWNVTGPNAGNVAGFSFSNFQNLTGGLAGNTFHFQPGSSITGTINGGGGANTLDYSAFAAPVTVNLQAQTATATGGFAKINSLVGSSSAANILVGPNTTNTWSIIGTNAGNVDGFSFSGVANLAGGTGVDAFVFGAGKSVTGKIDGGGGGDWLDYAAYTTPVSVNLSTGTATGVGGGIAKIQNVRGGQGGDTLTGSNALGNILIGGAGALTINGGTGRSILIADKGAGHINGGSGTDILIGAATTYDASSLANDIALQDILAEWQSGNSYLTRISNIKNGLGLTAGRRLRWGFEVKDNGLSDILTAFPTPDPPVSPLVGDWFFKGASTAIKNKESYEVIN